MTLPDWKKDGFEHRRGANGTCLSCGAAQNEYHYALKSDPLRRVSEGRPTPPPPPVTGLYLTVAELAELYVILDDTPSASAEILSKVSNALKGAL